MVSFLSYPRCRFLFLLHILFFFLKLFFLINTINSLPPLLPPSSALVCTSVCNAVTVRSTCCSSQHATNISVCFFLVFLLFFFMSSLTPTPSSLPLPNPSRVIDRMWKRVQKKEEKLCFHVKSTITLIQFTGGALHLFHYCFVVDSHFLVCRV